MCHKVRRRPYCMHICSRALDLADLEFASPENSVGLASRPLGCNHLAACTFEDGVLDLGNNNVFPQDILAILNKSVIAVDAGRHVTVSRVSPVNPFSVLEC